MWEKVFYFVAVPALIGSAANVIMHHGGNDRPEFIPYEHLRILNKVLFHLYTYTFSLPESVLNILEGIGRMISIYSKKIIKSNESKSKFNR